jgi:hydrogenase-1 operon protein HyaE
MSNSGWPGFPIPFVPNREDHAMNAIVQEIPALEHPVLVQRLVQDYGARTVGAEDADGFAAQHERAVLFFVGDTARHAESLDVAVILAELQALFAARGRGFAVGVVVRSAEAALQRRYGFQIFPSLVFLRRGQYLGTIGGVLDWAPFVARVDQILGAEPTRPPSVGIPVATSAAGAGCS